MSTQRQNADGSWSPAEPLPWSEQIDWEVYGHGRQRTAVAYWLASELARVGPGRWFRLRLWAAHRRLLRLRRRL